MRNKVIDLKEIVGYVSPDYLVLSEKKLDDSFQPNSIFQITKFKGLICKKLKIFEPRKSDCICSEITVSKKKLLHFSIYRPPSHDNLELFFKELTSCLSKASESYENFIVMGILILTLQKKGSNLIN